MKWLMFHSEALHDPKVQILRPELFKAWVNLLCLASQQDDRGTLPPIDHIAYALRLDPDKAAGMIDELKQARLIDDGGDDDGRLVMHNWHERQTSTPSSAERVRRYRERIRASGESVTGYAKHRDAVFERDGAACVYCLSGRSLVLDHLVPASRGGDGQIDNLVTACRSCNSGKAGRLVEETGYPIRRPETILQYESVKARLGIVTSVTVLPVTPVTVTSVTGHSNVTPVTPVTIRGEEKRREEKTPPPIVPPHGGAGDDGNRPPLPTIPAAPPVTGPIRPAPAAIPNAPDPATVADMIELARSSLGARCDLEDYPMKIDGWLRCHPADWVRDAILCTAAKSNLNNGGLAAYTAACLRRWHPNGPPRGEVESARRKADKTPAPVYKVVRDDGLFADTDREVLRRRREAKQA